MTDGIVGRRVRFEHNDDQDEGIVMAQNLTDDGFLLLVMTEDGDLATCLHTTATVLGDAEEHPSQ